MLSLHTSPLAQPGTGDSGGMNVYVREMASSLAQAGVQCTTYTRRTSADQPDAVQVEPGHRVVHVDAGPVDLPKSALTDVVNEFGDRVIEHLAGEAPADVVHANYWLSGLVAHRIKHELDTPFVTTFHTLAKVKAEGGDPEPEYRHRAEAEIIGCADAICVSCTEEAAQFRRLYGDPAGRIEIVAPLTASRRLIGRLSDRSAFTVIMPSTDRTTAIFQASVFMPCFVAILAPKSVTRRRRFCPATLRLRDGPWPWPI